MITSGVVIKHVSNLISKDN